VRLGAARRASRAGEREIEREGEGTLLRAASLYSSAHERHDKTQRRRRKKGEKKEKGRISLLRGARHESLLLGARREKEGGHESVS